MAFVLFRWRNVVANVGQEIAQAVAIERIKLEASVNGEIALALKMADSPLLKRHFLNPDEPDLRRIAFDEIAAYQQAFASKTVFWASDVDKEFYFDENNHYTIDLNNPDNYWYKMTLYETERFNFNINYNPEIQRIMLWINAPVFDSSRTPIGLVGTGIDLTNFVNTIFQNYSNKAELYFFNALGEVTGARDVRLVTNKVTIDNALGNSGKEIRERAQEIKANNVQYFSISGFEIAIGYVSALDWHIVAVLPVTLADVLNNAMTALFVAMISVIAAILVTFLLLMKWLLNPLNIMVSILDQISTDWDLTRRL